MFRDRDEILPPGALAHQALAEQTPEGKLRAWVEGHLEHVPAADKDRGSKPEELHGGYLRAGVHARSVLKRLWGRLRFKSMLVGLYPGVGPYRNTASTVSGLYLLR